MAKRTKAAGLELKAVRKRVDDVQAALAKIREEYQLGRRSREETNGPRAPYGSMRKLDNSGTSSELLRKARALAGEDGYTSSELNDLIRKCERADFAIGVSHLYRLCTVPKGKRNDVKRIRAVIGIVLPWLKSQARLRKGELEKLVRQLEEEERRLAATPETLMLLHRYQRNIDKDIRRLIRDCTG